MSDEPTHLPAELRRLGFPRPRRPHAPFLAPREQAALRIGLITVAAAELDTWLTTVIAWLVNPGQPPHQLVAGRPINDKLNMFKVMMPPEWPNSIEFVAAIRRVTEERNAVAHAIVEWDHDALVAMAEGDAPFDLDSVPLVFRRENKKTPMPVDEERLYSTQLNLFLLNMVALALWSDSMRMKGGERTEVVPDLPNWVLGWGADPRYSGWPNETRWENDVRSLFQLPRASPNALPSSSG